MSDYIDRQAVIDVLAEMQGLCTSKAALIQNSKIWQQIKDMPPAEVEPVKRGKWIYDNQFHWYRASCSECGYKRVTDIKAEKWNGWKYCPNCGAKMDAEEADHASL